MQIDGIGFTDDDRAGSAHLFYGLLRIVRIQIHSANRVTDQHDLKSFPNAVEHRVLDAIISGQATDKESIDTAIAQQDRQQFPVLSRPRKPE